MRVDCREENEESNLSSDLMFVALSLSLCQIDNMGWVSLGNAEHPIGYSWSGQRVVVGTKVSLKLRSTACFLSHISGDVF